MRRKITLYIAGQEVDLDDQSFILFNYAMDDLRNPTIVKNSYSQQITIKGTPGKAHQPGNNYLFGGMWKADRKTQDGGTQRGVDFNATKKTPFVIMSETNDILESGYCRLDKVDIKGEQVEYTITLFGGLGGFFYNLTYNEDGSKKTLADLYYTFGDDHPTLAKYIDFRIRKANVYNAWLALSETDDGTIYHQFNFAPAYNGLPKCKFGADKAVYHPGVAASAMMPNLYTSKTDDDVTYTTKDGANGNILLEMSNPHTEWEMQDLRSYLQRPIVSVKWLLTTLTFAENTGDYTFILDSDFFSDDNPWFEKAWMTLPMFDRDMIDPSDCILSDLLSGTDSPADYLIGFAKMFGLVFLTDPATKTITMTGRNKFFNDSVIIDLSKRVDVSKSITPVPMSAKWYIFQDEVFGQFAAEYALKYGKVYGSQWLNTGYDFNSDQVELLDICYRGAADVRESNGLFQVFGGQADSEYGSFVNYLFKIPFFEEVSWRLYNESEDETKELECKTTNEYLPQAPMPYSLSNPFNDFAIRVQLHGSDNSAEDGNNVLLFYNGDVETPVYKQGGIAIEEARFHLSDDTTEMLALNNGIPCWEVGVTGSNIQDIESMPMFRRWLTDYNGDIAASMDFGDPRELAHDGTMDAGFNIYNNFWQDYLSDRYDVDTKVVTCKVNLNGFQIGQELLRKFYWFDNCVWVMNKIINHSLTTYDMVECEFVKVADMNKYQTGQAY